MGYAKTLMGGGLSAGTASAISGGAATGLVTTGSSNTDALQLAALAAHHVTTSSASTGALLAAGVAGDQTAVFNNSGQTILIYPPSGAQINALTATTGGFSMANGKTALFVCLSATRWLGILTA